LLFAAFAISAGLGGIGAGYGVVAATYAASEVGLKGTLGALAVVCGNLTMTLVGVVSALFSTVSFTRGRQLRRFGRVLLPRVEAGDAWAAPSDEVGLADDLDEDTRHALAQTWRDNARTEHASVAAFARLTLDLIALGAPPALVASANRDALDEIRHAEMCFALARSIDGRAEGPAPFPEAARARTLSRVRSFALAELAVDSLIDGALHEGVSARIIAKLARRAVDPDLRAMLKIIAADEGRHARHGWDVVRFCLDEGGESVARALQGAIRALPRTMASELPEPARMGGWERFGIMSGALESREYEAARADLVTRVTDLLAPYEIATRRAA
jgi:hypothetical protein